MYLHIGSKKNIRQKDIIGIFDADGTTTSSITRKYLSAAQKKQLVLAACDELPKSFILYKDSKSGEYKRLRRSIYCGSAQCDYVVS